MTRLTVVLAWVWLVLAILSALGAVAALICVVLSVRGVIYIPDEGPFFVLVLAFALIVPWALPLGIGSIALLMRRERGRKLLMGHNVLWAILWGCGLALAMASPSSSYRSAPPSPCLLLPLSALLLSVYSAVFLWRDRPRR